MSKLDEAIKFAVDAHAGQLRKIRNTPYILHPLEAASIAGMLTKDEDIICAAVLHDVVEDTDRTLDEIRELFGERVAQLVGSETENKRRYLPPEATWRIRKEESLAHLRECNDIGIKTLWMADKLSNARSFYDAYELMGDAFWTQFNQKDKHEQAWYYREIYKILKPEFENTLAFKEYATLITVLFGEEAKNEI